MTGGKVDPEESLKEIFNLDFSACDLAVCLASFEKDSSEPKLEKLQLLGDVSNVFRSIVLFNLERHKTDSERRLLKYYFDTKSAANEIEYLHLNEAPYDIIKQQIDGLSKPLIGIEAYEEDKTFLKGVRFYIIVVQPPSHRGEEPICFFRSYTQKNKLRRGTFAVVWSGRGYDRVEAEKVFLFDNDIDCMSRGDLMYVFDKDTFHQMFRFFEELEKTAVESLNKIKHIPIAHFAEFEEACRKNPLKAAKLRSIAEKPYLQMLTIDKLKRFIKKRHLDMKIETDEDTGQEMLVYDARSSWKLLKLLDDDYLLSELTEHSYEVNGKREL
jgi:hypothetical protein